MKISVPWAAHPWVDNNGLHPLALGMLRSADGVIYDNRISQPTDAAVRRARQQAITFRDSLRAANAGPDGLIDSFVAGRGIDEQAQIPVDADGVFIHAVPKILPGKKFAYHTEILDSVFWGLHGLADQEVDVPKSAFTPMLRQLFEHDDCRLILLHLRDTAEAFPRLFNSPALADKIHYVRLGVDYERSLRDETDRIRSRESRSDLTFLFTNSFGHQPGNFIDRAGIEVIEAFRRVSEIRPLSRLLILSAVPQGLERYIEDARFTLPNLTYIDRRVSELELIDLYLDSDVFALPSIWLHSYSLLRAMAAGVVPIVGHLAHYEEFVTHGESALFVARGYQPIPNDPQNGLGPRASLIKADLVQRFDQKLSDQIFRAMMWLSEDRRLLRKMKHNCLQTIAEKHALEPWQTEIRRSIRNAF